MTLASPPYRLTADDLLRLPDNHTLELVDGKILEKNASFLSSDTELQVAALLRAFADRTGVAKVLPATMGYQCFQSLVDDPDRVRKPDASVIRMDRIKNLTNPNAGYLRIVPDLAVEVISTHYTVGDLDDKLLEYHAAGFPLVWIVDPLLRSVTVHPNPGKPFIRTGDDELTAEDALPGFACKVSDLFPQA